MKEKFKKLRLDDTIEVTLKTRGQLDKMWTCEKRWLCEHIVDVTEDFAAQGYKLTLRQLYYQLVGKNLIPNHMTVYKKLGRVKDALAYGGVLDWATFEDRNRKPSVAYTEISPKEALKNTLAYYNLDKQAGQSTMIEVHSEKDAISGILSPVTRKYTVPLVINRGYSGSTAMYEAYKRFTAHIQKKRGNKAAVIYFGDFDPSGLDMVRDIEDRLIYMMVRGENGLAAAAIDWYSEYDCIYDTYDLIGLAGYERLEKMTAEPTERMIDLYTRAVTELYIRKEELLTIQHAGLTRPQIDEYNPPPNPAKITDSRAAKYIAEHGSESWEVDALSPAVMSSLAKSFIIHNMEADKFNEVVGREKKDKAQLKRIIDSIDI